MQGILAPVAELVSSDRETIEIEVDSDRLVPSFTEDAGNRMFWLTYGDETYPVLKKGWTSWSSKVLRPRSSKNKEKGQWSDGTVRKFLDLTPVDHANKIVKSWWEDMIPEPWHIVKYVDNGSRGEIRFIGSKTYKLFTNKMFLDSLDSSDLSGMILRQQTVGENGLSVRVTDEVPMFHGMEDMDGRPVEIFSGFHFSNSENGSYEISIRHLLFDLICTNGLMIMFGKSNIIRQKHINFDIDKLVNKIKSVSDGLSAFHEMSMKVLNDIIHMNPIPMIEVDAVLSMLETKYGAPKAFVKSIASSIDDGMKNVWSLISDITYAARDLPLVDRMRYESSAGKIMLDIAKRAHHKFLKARE